MRIGIVLGTRPEIIKMSPVIDELINRGHDYFLIHTGQHYDNNMSGIFFKELKLRTPDYILSGINDSVAIIDILEREKPDVVLTQGDTNSAVDGAIAAKRAGCPLGHVEAGLRSFDMEMPEEVNRRIVDAASDMLFCPTQTSFDHLRDEKALGEKHIVGNTIVEACTRNLKLAEEKYNVARGGDYAICTIHRPENTDHKDKLTRIVKALIDLDFPIVFPCHPRTKEALKKFNLYDLLEYSPFVHIYEPFGYFSFLSDLKRARLILTDSGGLQEEAITLGIPCITIRNNTERPETIKVGGNILTGAHRNEIYWTARRIWKDPIYRQRMVQAPNPYGGVGSRGIVNHLENYVRVKGYERGIF